MNYKVGDKVLMRDDLDTAIWTNSLVEEYHNLHPKVVTISAVHKRSNERLKQEHYEVEELSNSSWYDKDMIGLYEDFKEIYDPIESRFDIIDL